MELKDILIDMSKSVGIGNIFEASELAVELLTPYVDEISTDHTGSVTAIIKGKSDYKIMLEAHIDEVGMIVTSVADNGFLRVAQTGTVDVRVLPASSVVIHARRKIKGVFCSTPPHLSKGNDDKFSSVDKLWLDTGLTDDEAKDLIKVGDYITYDVTPAELLGGQITGKSMDDRSGCAALIYAAKLIKSRGVPENTIVISLASGEELGNRGAITAAFRENANEAVAVDVSFGLSPGAPAEKCGVLSKGGMIGISPVLSKPITAKLEQTAKKLDLPYQYEGMGGETSTDADVISITKSGIPCGLLSIPLKYMHTPIETVAVCDVENVARILAEYAVSGGIKFER